MNESKRQLKVGKLLQTDLAEIFQRELSSLLGNKALVTITKVRVTPDLGIARVYLSIFNDDADTLLQTINEHNKNIRFKLGLKIKNQVRAVPQLQFFIDDSLDYIDKIDELLKDD